MKSQQRIEDLQRKLAELRNRIPPHSIPPRMLEEIEELEEEIARLRQE